MKLLLIVSALSISNLLFAGGVGGGGVPPSVSLIDSFNTTINLDELPTVHVDVDNFRRAKARLSTANTKDIPLLIDNREVRVKKVFDKIVDTDLTNQFLPDYTTIELPYFQN